MDNEKYIQLRDDSQSSTFVTRNRTQLNQDVREYLTCAVTHYSLDAGSHKLDAKTGIQVALDFKPAYMPIVRSAMSKVKGLVWSVDSGIISYSKPDKPRVPVALETVLEDMNAALDKIDEGSARPEITEDEKLKRAAKRRLTGIINTSDQELALMVESIDKLTPGEFANLGTVLAILNDAMIPQLAAAA